MSISIELNIYLSGCNKGQEIIDIDHMDKRLSITQIQIYAEVNTLKLQIGQILFYSIHATNKAIQNLYSFLHYELPELASDQSCGSDFKKSDKIGFKKSDKIGFKKSDKIGFIRFFNRQKALALVVILRCVSPMQDLWFQSYKRLKILNILNIKIY